MSETLRGVANLLTKGAHMKRINAATVAAIATLSTLILAALTPFSAPLSGHTIAVLVLGVLALVAGTAAAREGSNERTAR